MQTNGAFEVLHGELELQESLDGVAGNLIKGRQVIVEFNQFFITKVPLLSLCVSYKAKCKAKALEQDTGILFSLSRKALTHSGGWDLFFEGLNKQLSAIGCS